MEIILPSSTIVLCDMEITMRSADTRFSAFKTACSVSTSRFAVISSRRRSSGSAAAARAMESSLPLSLGEQLRRALRIVAVLHLHNVLVQAGQNRGPLHRFHGNVFIKQRDLFFDCARHPVEGLLHIAEQLYKKSLQILILCGSEAQ